MIIPKAAPKYGFPPNFLVALNPINTGKKVNAAFENKLIIDAKSAHCGYASIKLLLAKIVLELLKYY